MKLAAVQSIVSRQSTLYTMTKQSMVFHVRRRISAIPLRFLRMIPFYQHQQIHGKGTKAGTLRAD